MNLILPNAILIGAQKSGTTALFDWIGQHPEVYGDPTMKDFPFFCHDGYYTRGLDWFSTCFRNWEGQKIILHGYVHYLSLYEETAANLKQFEPSLKLIVSLRNPVDRAYSAYLQARKTGYEPLDTFEKAIDHERKSVLKNFSDITNRGYIMHGYYSQQLKQYYRLFPKSQIFVTLFDDLADSPVGVCQDIYKFLDVDDSFRPLTVRKNDYGEVRSQLFRRLIGNGISIEALRELIPINTRIRIRRLFNQLNTRAAEKPALSKATRNFLHGIYQEEIKELEILLDRDLRNWRIQR